MNHLVTKLLSTGTSLENISAEEHMPSELLQSILNAKSLFDLGNYVPHAKTVYFCANRGGIGKTSSALNTAVALALKGYKVLLTDINGGQVGVKGRLGDLDNHGYGLYELVTSDKGRLSILGDTELPLDEINDQERVVFTYDIDGKNSFDIFQQYGGLPIPHALQLMVNNKFLTNKDNFRMREDMKDVTNRFKQQWLKVDQHYDYIVMDMPSTVQDEYASVMRKYSNNHIMVLIDPNDMESINGAIPMVQTILEGQDKTEFCAKIMLVFTEEPYENNRLSKQFVIDYIADSYNISAKVLLKRFTVGVLFKEKKELVKKHEFRVRKPWFLEDTKSFNVLKPAINSFVDYLRGEPYKVPEASGLFGFRPSKILGKKY